PVLRDLTAAETAGAATGWDLGRAPRDPLGLRADRVRRLPAGGGPRPVVARRAPAQETGARSGEPVADDGARGVARSAGGANRSRSASACAPSAGRLPAYLTGPGVASVLSNSCWNRSRRCTHSRNRRRSEHRRTLG